MQTSLILINPEYQDKNLLCVLCVNLSALCGKKINRKERKEIRQGRKEELIITTA